MKVKSKNIIYFDPLAPKGHITLNKFYIDNLARAGDEVFVGESIAPHFGNHDGVKAFSECYLTKGRLIHSLSTFLWGFICILHARRKGANVCFLSYDMTNFFILTHVSRLLNVNIYCFEHNTSPRGSNFKNLLQRLCSKRLIRFCYTENIKSNFEFTEKIKVIPHPLLTNLSKSTDLESDFLSVKSNYRKIIFCPSASADIKKIENAAQRMPDILFVLKSKEVLSSKNIFSKPFFENYNRMMEISDFIYLPLHNCSRVSGPFYEGVCKGKNILLEKNSFGNEIKKEFPEHVQFIEDDFFKKNVKFDIPNYNSQILNSLSKALYE
ncbi:hypothetical protein [Vibrio sp.]|uniref:hypothetical protein n=1 Tax=Vibrio sp. TaxID=678 RepID=UPI003F6CCB87